jgi:hypothetical protein
VITETLSGGEHPRSVISKRAFGWIAVFLSFRAGITQTLTYTNLPEEERTYIYTRGKAELYINDQYITTLVPGSVSTDLPKTELGAKFELRFIEETSRVCMPAAANHGVVPTIRKIMLEPGESFNSIQGERFLVCSGTVSIGERSFTEKESFEVSSTSVLATATERTIVIQFLKSS